MHKGSEPGRIVRKEFQEEDWQVRRPCAGVTTGILQNTDGGYHRTRIIFFKLPCVLQILS